MSPQSDNELNMTKSSQQNLVGVVIPSTGRPCLIRAIESVLSQSHDVQTQIIVVFDLAESDVPEQAAFAALKAHKVLYTGGGKRACYARNLGVSVSGAPWIAFLDDDDLWRPTKLAAQLVLAGKLQAEGKRPVVGSRASLSIGAPAPTVTGVPARLISPKDRVEDYLFRRRRAGSRRASFFTSSILAERDLCVEVPWDQSLQRHQDWDWLVKVGRVENVAFAQDQSDLVIYNVGSEGSISAKPDWAPSLLWARTVLAESSPKTLADFLAAQTLRYALQMRSAKGFVSTMAAITRTNRLPSLSCWVVGLAGLLPRKQIQRIMSVVK